MKILMGLILGILIAGNVFAKTISFEISDEIYSDVASDFCSANGWSEFVRATPNDDLIKNPESCENFLYRSIAEYIKFSIAIDKYNKELEINLKIAEDNAKIFKQSISDAIVIESIKGQ